MTLQELEAQRAQIDAQIAEARKAARDGVAQRVLALLAEAGMTLADLGYAPARAPKQRKPRASASAPKYVGPEAGQSWGGRGKRPTWLNKALAAGKPLSEFAAQ